jgi:hypothetical protein
MRLSYAMADLDGLVPQVVSLSSLRIVLQNLNQNGLVLPPSPFALVTFTYLPMRIFSALYLYISPLSLLWYYLPRPHRNMFVGSFLGHIRSMMALLLPCAISRCIY